jgi:multiple sugar transport system permease protein
MRTAACGCKRNADDDRESLMSVIRTSVKMQRVQGQRVRLADNDGALGNWMLAPAVVYIVLLVAFPFLLSMYYSVSDATVGNTVVHFVGMDNFKRITESKTFWRSMANTFVFTLMSQVLVVILAKILAMALYKDFRGKWLVRLLILLPWVAPISLGTIGWLWIFDPVYSIINWTLRAASILPANIWPIWLGQPNLAMASIVLVDVWRLLPLATVIILAGLSGIPQDIHDAAEMDGASFWRHLFQINIPLVMPIMLIALLFGIVFTFTDMIIVYVLTRGGPFDTTQVLASLAFFTGVPGGDLAEGAAISLFLFPLLVAVVILLLTIARRTEIT